MEKYCLENNVPFKIFITADNGSRHSPFLGDLHLNIKLMCLPLNTTSLMKNEQEVIAAFKAYKVKKTFVPAIPATGKTERRN